MEHYIFSMRLEDKLSNLDHYLKYQQSHQHSNSQAQILKACYYQMHSLRNTMNNNHSIIVEENTSCLTAELPKMYKQSKISQALPKVETKSNLYQSQSLLLPRDHTLQYSFSQSSLSQFLNRSQRDEQINQLFSVKEDRCLEQKKMYSKRQLTSILSKGDKREKSNKPEKENKIHKKAKSHRQRLILGREQRYFQVKEVKIDEKTIERMGLYEAGQLFKTKNIEQKLKDLSVVAEKHQFNPVVLGNSCDLFMTNIEHQPSDFCVQTFIEEEIGRHKISQNAIQQCDSSLSSKTMTPEVEPIPAEKNSYERTKLFLTFKQYHIVHDSHYKVFKNRHLQAWGSVLLNIQTIIRCLKKLKINLIKVKQEHLLNWQGKKIIESQLNKLIGLKNNVKLEQRVERTVLAFIDRLKVAVMKRRIRHRENQLRWVAERLKGIYKLRQRRKEKYEIAQKLQFQLRDEMEWQVQIHIPSFSVDSFQRNTTQYMESLQAQYHCLWEASNCHLVLVLPSLNEKLLRLIQSRLKLRRPVTIVTPEIYSVFPPNLPLAAQVYFSSQTLIKIQKTVSNRKAIIIGSQYSNSKYERLISQFLKIPILNSIRSRRLMEEQKLFYKQAKIQTAPYCLIPSETSQTQLYELFAELLMDKVAEKTWVLKIEGEFKGRGIATVKINPSKYIRKEMDHKQGVNTLVETLRNTLRLKLKVNFQNSVYMVQDFLTTLRKEGGIIEERLQIKTTFECCFYKVRNCHLRSLFKVYGTNFSNKAWLSSHPDPALACEIQKISAAIQNNYNYLGYISTTICLTSSNEYIGVDIKFGQSLASSLSSFIEMVQAKRQLQGTEALNVQKLPTRRPSYEPGESPPPEKNSSFRYLFIPAFPFTDVDEFGKFKLIQELMAHCWNDRHLRLGYPGKVFLSMGLDLSAVLMGKDVKRLKREGVDLVREIAEKVRLVKEYRGKEVVRDVFQSGDVIRAISHIKAEQ